MNKVDILIVGASTTGCWFARKMAENGFKVLVIEKEERDKVSRDYDIFHMCEKEMIQHNLTIPAEESSVREFRFERSNMGSPYNTVKIPGAYDPVIGMHKHSYIDLMADEATSFGAEIIYGATFFDLIFDENNKVIGGKYKKNGEETEVYASLVADCSGIPSVARRCLPDSSVVENFPLTPKDILYVVLYYVNYKDKNLDPSSLNAFYMQYKSWFAPAGEGYDGLLGIGAFNSYAYAEYIYENDFCVNVKVPEYDLLKIEKGMTPYHRNLFSTVDDGFIAMGDSAFLTKPTCGEGCTSSLVHSEIAVEVITALLKNNKPLTKENMWSINSRYIKGQGKEFDSLRALLRGVITISYKEAEYMFNNDLLFSEKILGNMDGGINLGFGDITHIVGGIIKGIATKNIKFSTVKNLMKALSNSDKVTKLYDTYPDDFNGFNRWKNEADALWKNIGKLSDTSDENIIKLTENK